MTQRAKFLTLLAIFAVPTIASFIVFYWFPPTRTSNYGTLISPVASLPEVAMTRLDKAGDGGATPALRGRWLLVTRDSGACLDACQKKLYAMRQSRLILGREQERVLRVVLVDDGTVPSQATLDKSDGTFWVAARDHPWLAALAPHAGETDPRAAIYAVDTLGNAFMRYSADPDIKKLSNDLKRVLKASQIG